jgi:hypothetical protein
MADEPQTPDSDDELLLTKDDQLGPDDDQTNGPGDEGEDEEVVTFGDEAAPQDGETGLVKHLRQVAKDAQREAAELRKQVRQPENVAIGPKPTLWDEGIDGDEDKYDAAMDAWKGRKAADDRQSFRTDRADRRAAEASCQRLEKVVPRPRHRSAADADEAFENVKAVLGEERAAAIVMITDTPEKPPEADLRARQIPRPSRGTGRRAGPAAVRQADRQAGRAGEDREAQESDRAGHARAWVG